MQIVTLEKEKILQKKPQQKTRQQTWLDFV